MSGVRPGTCGEPGPYNQHCTEPIGHRYACYDAGEDASFTHWMMERGDLPPHQCDDPACPSAPVSERGSSSLPAVLPPLLTALFLFAEALWWEQVRTLVWTSAVAGLLLVAVVGCVWLAGRLTARPPMTEHLRDEAAVLIERGRR